MPTCPAFSSDGVPGPLAGRESAPSVALYIRLFIYFLFSYKQNRVHQIKWREKKEREAERERERKKKGEKKQKTLSWLQFFLNSQTFY